jgi:hypothetical protein
LDKTIIHSYHDRLWRIAAIPGNITFFEKAEIISENSLVECFKQSVTNDGLGPQGERLLLLARVMEADIPL